MAGVPVAHSLAVRDGSSALKGLNKKRNMCFGIVVMPKDGPLFQKPLGGLIGKSACPAGTLHLKRRGPEENPNVAI